MLRYSALITGIFYGIYHQSSLLSQQKANDLNRKYSAEESLIAKAKAEYVKKTLPQDKKNSGGGGELPSWQLVFEEGQGIATRQWLSQGGCSILDMANVAISTVTSDPDDAQFDLEAYLTKNMADEAKQ